MVPFLASDGKPSSYERMLEIQEHCLSLLSDASEGSCCGRSSKRCCGLFTLASDDKYSSDELTQ